MQVLRLERKGKSKAMHKERKKKQKKDRQKMRITDYGKHAEESELEKKRSIEGKK